MSTTDHTTPEEAAAAVRNGRAGYILAVSTPAGRWTAFGDYVATTKEDARMKARVAMVKAGDPSRVVLVDEHNQRLHVPAPRELTRKKGAAPQ